MTAKDDYTEIKVDVGVLKTQVSSLCALCSKMDTLIEKVINNQDKYIEKIYMDMEDRRKEKNEDLKLVHTRIDIVLEQVKDMEERIKHDLKELSVEMAENNKKEQESLDKINQWKWMVAGGIIVLSWLISHIELDTIVELMKK